MPRLIMKAAILAAGVSSASAWASMVAQEGAMEGAPGMAPGMAPGPAPGFADAPGPSVTAPLDPYAEPEYTKEKFDVFEHHTYTPTILESSVSKKKVEPSGDCKDYTWDENGVMSYGPVPCDDKPNYMEAAPTQTYVEHDGQLMAAVSIDPLIESIDDAHARNCARVYADAMMSDMKMATATIDFPADAEEESCDALLSIFEYTEADGLCCQVVDTRRRALKSNTFVLEVDFDPTALDSPEVNRCVEKLKAANIAVEFSVGADPQEKLEALGLYSDAVSSFEDQVKNGQPMPITTPPNVVGAPLTGCYELDSSPPEGYVHAESNLEFDVLRGEHESVKFEVESEKFTSLTCSEAPTHHFQGSDYCKGTEKCDETCRMIMPPKCNTTEASFGVCAPTVKTVCDAMDNSKTACTLASQKVLGATVSYNHLDVQNSPCISSIHKVTADAHEAYRIAYDEWVFAYNNASHACKVGTAIRDYNGMAFVQHHQNMDNIQKVSEMVCDDLDGFDFTKAHPKRKLLSTTNATKNSETCSNIKQLIEEIKADTDLASRQIQCFASECMATKSLEAYKFQALDNKFFEYNSTLFSYKSSVETYNNAVADKYLKKAAAEEAFDVFRPLKGDMTAKFHKDLEVYMSFASGAAEGNCGLTDCEMTAVCSFEMQYKFSDYVTKSERGCVRNDKPLVELCYSQEEEEARR